jgi:hypothetical protein
VLSARCSTVTVTSDSGSWRFTKIMMIATVTNTGKLCVYFEKNGFFRLKKKLRIRYFTLNYSAFCTRFFQVVQIVLSLAPQISRSHIQAKISTTGTERRPSAPHSDEAIRSRTTSVPRRWKAGCVSLPGLPVILVCVRVAVCVCMCPGECRQCLSRGVCGGQHSYTKCIWPYGWRVQGSGFRI